MVLSCRHVGVVAGVGTVSGVVTLLINLTPEAGDRVALFVVFGLFLGLSWMVKGIQGVIAGLVAGAVVGMGNAMIVSAIENSLSEMTGIERSLLELMKWVLPIVFNTFVGGMPWVTSDDWIHCWLPESWKDTCCVYET